MIISTSPYYTKRAKLEWSKLNETNFIFGKALNGQLEMIILNML